MATGEELIKKFNKVKTLPHIITKLSQLIADDKSSLKDFEKVISMDPALVARLLTVVNSSYYGLINRVDSITRALALLGIKNLHNIAITDALRGIFDTTCMTSSFSRSRLWTHCGAVAICSKMISERILAINGDDAYLCGLLHDIGIVVEDQIVPEQFIKAYNEWATESPTISELEQRIIGTDHGQIGYLLAREWLLGEDVALAILDHHLISDEIIPKSMTGILQMAEYLCSRIGYGAKDDVKVPLSPALEIHIHENLEEYNVLTEDLSDEILKAERLYES